MGSAFKSRHLEDFKLESDLILFISVIVINDSFTEANKFSDSMDFFSTFSFVALNFYFLFHVLSPYLSILFFFFSLTLLISKFLSLPFAPSHIFCLYQAVPEMYCGRCYFN